ncbi:MAG: STAS domain-containing protein [Methylorubrum populi]
MPDPHVFRPPADCSLREIRRLKDEIEAALKAAEALTIDCGTVERADLSFVQLLHAAHRTARRDAKVLHVANLSLAARSAFARAGLPDADRLSATA